MDLDIHERQQASSLFAILAFISVLLLIFHKQPWVNDLRSVLQWTTGPTHRFLSEWRADPSQSAPPASSSSGLSSQPPLWAMAPESLRAVQFLRVDNQRLQDVLKLKQMRWPGAVAARVVGRDPQRWFQEIVIDKGSADGIVAESAVVAIVNGREGLVGRITDVMDHTAKVLLIQDSLSSVAAHLQGVVNEDGVVEGTNGHDLLLKYLDRSSPVKMGDAVVTAGLGTHIPAEIPIGWVQDISLDPRQLFLQARLRSFVSSNTLRIVLVLIPAQE